jgi:hypothetical protein
MQKFRLRQVMDKHLLIWPKVVQNNFIQDIIWQKNGKKKDFFLHLLKKATQKLSSFLKTASKTARTFFNFIFQYFKYKETEKAKQKSIFLKFFYCGAHCLKTAQAVFVKTDLLIFFFISIKNWSCKVVLVKYLTLLMTSFVFTFHTFFYKNIFKKSEK